MRPVGRMRPSGFIGPFEDRSPVAWFPYPDPAPNLRVSGFMSPAGLRALVLLSVLAAVLTIGLKAFAYSLTRSVGLLSDALESGINLFAALTAYLSLHYSHRP